MVYEYLIWEVREGRWLGSAMGTCGMTMHESRRAYLEILDDALEGNAARQTLVEGGSLHWTGLGRLRSRFRDTVVRRGETGLAKGNGGGEKERHDDDAVVPEGAHRGEAAEGRRTLGLNTNREERKDPRLFLAATGINHKDRHRFGRDLALQNGTGHSDFHDTHDIFRRKQHQAGGTPNLSTK